MHLESLVFWSLLVGASYGQNIKGLRHRRQGPEGYNATSTSSKFLTAPKSTTETTSSSQSSRTHKSPSSSSETTTLTLSSVISTSVIVIVSGSISTSQHNVSTLSSTSQSYSIVGTSPKASAVASTSSRSYSIVGTPPVPHSSLPRSIQSYSIVGTSPTPQPSKSYPSQSYSIRGTAPGPYGSSSLSYSSQSYSFAPSGYAPSPIGPGTATGNATNVYAPTGTGYQPHRNVSEPHSNATCSGRTLNVLGASLDWWWTRTIFNPVSTFEGQYSNGTRTGWKVVGATTTFDITSAIASATCTSSLSYYSVYNASFYVTSCFAPATPVAAATTVITQTAFKPLNATTGTGPLPNVVSTPPPATINVPGPGGSYGEGTPLVFFSAYEIMTKSKTTNGAGVVGCAEATHVYQMEEPFSFEYTGGDVNGSQLVNAGVTGDVNPAFLGIAGVTGAVAGSWVAAPTVAVVVQDVYAAAPGVLARPEQSSLETPTPTLPSFITPSPTQTTGKVTEPTGGHIESSAQSLDIPTQGHNGGGGTSNGGGPATSGGQGGTSNGGGGATPVPTTPSNGGGGGGAQTTKPFVVQTGDTQTTLNIVVGPTQSVLTTVVGGKTVIATAASVGVGGGGGNGHSTQGGGGQTTQGGGGQTTQGNGGQSTQGGGGFKSIISAVLSVVKPSPTNALSVLSSADQTFAHTNPTASAILNGIGGPNTGKGNPGGSSPVTNGPGGVVNGETSNLASPVITPAPVITIGGTAFSANDRSTFIIDGQTLTPGGAITIDGTKVSLAPGASSVLINGKTLPLANPAVTSPLVIAVGGTTYTENAGSSFVIDGQTLSPGGSITVDSSIISLAPGGASNVVINGHTEALSSKPLITQAPVLTIGGHTYAPEHGTTYVISGSTLTPGGSIVLDSTTISLGPNFSSIVINGLTHMLSPNSVPVSITAPPVLTIGGQTFTAINSGATYVIGSQTFSSGEIETVTINGKTYIISFLPGATVLMIETEGPNGKVTATTYETLLAGSGTRPTVTSVVGVHASAGARPSGSASASISVQPALQNGVAHLAASVGGMCVALGSLAFAVWL